MQPSDFEKFRNLLFGMAKLYDKEIDGTMMDAYWIAMRDWQLADFQDAAALLMQTKNFMPRPADFQSLRKATQVGANEAWLVAMSRDWRRDQPRDLITKAMNAAGGYRHAQLADTETQLPHVMRRFLAAYEELSESESARQALPNIATAQSLPEISKALRVF